MLAQLNSTAPRPSASVPPPTPPSLNYSLTIIGDVHGIVASQIAHLNVGASTAELQSAFGELLQIAKQHPDEPGRKEVTELVQGLVEQAQKGPAHNRSVAKTTLAAIDTTLRGADLAVRAAPYLPAIITFFEQVTKGS